MSKLKQAYLALFQYVRKEHSSEISLGDLMQPDLTWDALHLNEKQVALLLQSVAESVHDLKLPDHQPYSKKIALSLMYLINQKKLF